MDPFSLVKEEIESVSERLRRSIFTGIPTLRSAAEYFFKVSSHWLSTFVKLTSSCIKFMPWHMATKL